MINIIDNTIEDQRILGELNINHHDIDNDWYDYSKVIVKKPWGYEYLIFSNQEVAIWILYIKPNFQTSMHCHTNKTTSLVVLEGQVTCSSLGMQFDKKAGEGLLIKKGAFHQTTAVSPDGAFVLELETPVNKRDLVRLSDNYGRVGMGYETADRHAFDLKNYNYISFQTSNMQHNFKKRFAGCSLTFNMVSTHDDIDKIQYLSNRQDIVILLDGKLVDSSGKSALSIGEAITVEQMNQRGPLYVNQASQILTVNPIDHALKISDYVAGFLRDINVDPVFVVPGDANVHLLDSIGRCEGIEFVTTKNEKSAATQVESFSKTRSGLGVLVVSSGASSANVVPGVANAWVDSVPMMVISGQASTVHNSDGQVRQLGNKEVDATGIVDSITKYAVKVTDPTMIAYHLEKAAYLATEGRNGPVWVDVPIDIQGMIIEEQEFKHFDPLCLAKTCKDQNVVSQQTFKRVIDLIRQSKRPVILAGNGIRLSDAVSEFLDLVDKLKIPVLTSRRGADILSDDNLFFWGRPGTYGQRSANFIIQNCDLLLSIGSRLSIPLVGRNTDSFAREAFKIVVDVDPHELSKSTIYPDLPIFMDAKEFILQILPLIPEQMPNYSSWIDQCSNWRSRFPVEDFEVQGKLGDFRGDHPVYPMAIIQCLSDRLSKNDVVVADGGATLIYTLLGFKFKFGQRLISSTGLELPGFAVAGSIGSCFANGRSRIICICEDRGFQLSLQDLQTILDYKLPIKILVMNSRGHSIIRNIQRDYFGGRFVGTDHEILTEEVSVSKIANTLGFPTFDVTYFDQLCKTIDDWLDLEGPSVCEIQVIDDQDKMPRPGFTINHDQEWLAKPLEDMVPSLERKILEENMLIDLVEEN